MAEQKEKWIQWVALTTTILAVSAAISSLKGGSYSTQVQLKNTQEANRWAYYQAKSLKQNLAELEREHMGVLALEARTPEGRGQAEKALHRATGRRSATRPRSGRSRRRRRSSPPSRPS